jgi:hypothetical protein
LKLLPSGAFSVYSLMSRGAGVLSAKKEKPGAIANAGKD